MKNVKAYEKKLRKLLSETRKGRLPDISPGAERVYFLLEAIMQADATRKQAAEALRAIREEYVDLNEVRVSPIRDIVGCIGRDCHGAQEKAQEIVNVLNNIFLKTNGISLDNLAELSKQDLKRCLLEMGLDPYAEAAVRLAVFGVRCVPVDEALVACLAKDGYVAGDASLGEVQSLLERLVGSKDALGIHELLRIYVEKQVRHLPRRPVPTAAAVIPAPKPFNPIVALAPYVAQKATEEAAKAGEHGGKAPQATPRPKPKAHALSVKRLSKKKSRRKMKKPDKKSDGKK